MVSKLNDTKIGIHRKFLCIIRLLSCFQPQKKSFQTQTNIYTIVKAFIIFLCKKAIMMKNLSCLLTILLLSIVSLTVNAQISGTTFRDFNGNGTRQTAAGFVEPIVSGIIVNAYNSSDVLVASYTTTAAGLYSIPASGAAFNGIQGSNTGFVASGTAVRLEFIIPSSGSCSANSQVDFSSGSGATYGTSVRFLSAGAGAVNINYALNNPANYFKASNPYFYTVRHVNGDPLAASGTATTRPAIEGTPYNANRTTVGATTPVQRTLAASYIGNCYGLGYSKQSGKLFTAAFIKRHAGLGTLGSGGIYMMDTSLSTGSVVNLFNMDANGYPTRSNSATGAPAFGAGTSYDVASATSLSYLGTTDPVTGLPLGQGVVGSNAARGLTGAANAENADPSAYGQAGIVGLGDLEVSEDGRYLYVVNLYDRKVYRHTLNSITNPTAVTATVSYTIPNPPLRNTLGGGYATTYAGDNAQFYDGTKGRLRPFALKYHRGKLYVGAVTTGEGTGAVSTTDNNAGNPEYTDLWAYVFEFDPSTNTWAASPTFQSPLNFNRGTNGDGYDETFELWRNTSATTTFTWNTEARLFYSQAMFTDIEFDPADGSMIIGLRDRIGDQVGHFQRRFNNVAGDLEVATAVGEILRAYRTSSCSYELESAGKEGPSSAKAATAGAANGQGPGGGEFYYQDHVFNGNTNTSIGTFHMNTTQGSIAVLPGKEEITVTGMDPNAVWSQGVDWFNSNTGANTRDHMMEVSNANDNTTGYAGKGCGLGDIEILTYGDIEIGNRIWNDANGNGIQDAGEAVLANVTLELFLDADNNGIPDGAAIGTVITSASGTYFFTSAPGTDVTGVDYSVVLQPNQNYIIRVAAADWNSTTGAGTGDLAGYQLTKTDKAGNGTADLSDNDASLSSGATIIPQIRFTTGDYGQNNHNLDFGFKLLASLGDKVWLDNSKDGVQQAAEPGVSGITVTLKNSSAAVVASTVTDTYGNYFFDNLTAGDYTVTFTLPANYTFTTQTNTADDNNTTGASTTGSDVNITTGQSYTVTLSNGENNRNIDAGIIFNTPTLANSIGDKVWFDTNGNGTQDGTEPGVAGVTVTLYASNGTTVIATTITDANGNYWFTNLPASTNYIVGITPPAGMIFTSTSGTTAGNATINSDVDNILTSTTAGKTTVINTGIAGNQITGIDAGLIPQANNTASLGDKVWNDINNNGTQDAGEPGIAGVTVNLYEDVNGDGLLAGGELVAVRTTVTDVFGYYIFNNLAVTYSPFNNYWQVEFTQPSGYNNTAVADNNSGNDALDSDIINDATDRTGFIRLKQNDRNTKVDAGFVQAAPAGALKLGNLVWRDDNGDGQQLATEPGVPGISVKLYQNGTDGLPGTADDVLINTTTTDINGNYLFVNLAASSNAATNYNVEFTNIPSGFSITQQDAGADVTDNDANSLERTGSINLTADNFTVDAGISQGKPSGLASLGDKVWYDLDNNGIQDAGELGTDNVTVTLYLDANGDGLITGGEQTPIKTTATNALGEYMFDGLNAGSYQAGFALPAPLSTYTLSAKDAGTSDALDSDGNAKNTSISGNVAGAQISYTNLIALAQGEDKLTVDLGIVPPAATNTLGGTAWFDTDANGTQTSNPGRVPGVVVKLYNSGGTVIATTTTDKNGDYLFVGLADGSYSVGFDGFPTGFSLTSKSATNDAAGSDPDLTNGNTATVALNAGNRNDRSLDAGLISTRAALGNKVWEDLNGDGIQDAGEPGIAGVTVTLWDDLTNQVASMITDENGYYYFPNLISGNWQVGISTTPESLSVTQKDNITGPDGNGTNTWTGGGDNDINPTGVFANKTDVFALAASELNLTVDAGLRRLQIATVGNIVWDDLDGNGLQDAGEPGIAGVVAVLYNSSNQPIGSAVTDGNGNWLITNVPFGTGYYVIFSNKPIGNFTIQDNGGAGTGGVTDTDNDSDANAAGQTGNFDVTANSYNVKIDAGITMSIVLPVRLLSFTAVPENSIVKFHWKVADQINIDAYTVEFSTDGRNFSSISSTQANTLINDYQAAHNNPVKGINYYRLKITEQNGRVVYSDIRKVNFSNNTDILVYPAPAATFVNVTLPVSSIAKPLTVIISSADGKTVMNKYFAAASQTETIDVSKFASGTYYMRINTGNETTVKTIQVIK